MKRINYDNIDGMSSFYLEDSFVISIRFSDGNIYILSEIVVIESSPLYAPPKPDEQYCYRRGEIVFEECNNIKWIRCDMRPVTDVDGTVDYGNIDYLYIEDNKFYISGEWGEMNFDASGVRVVLS